MVFLFGAEPGRGPVGTYADAAAFIGLLKGGLEGKGLGFMFDGVVE